MDMRESAHRRMEADLKEEVKETTPSEKGHDIAALVAGEHHILQKNRAPQQESTLAIGYASITVIPHLRYETICLITYLFF